MKISLVLVATSLASFGVSAWEKQGHGYAIQGEQGSAIMDFIGGGQMTRIRFVLPVDYGRVGSRCAIGIDGKKANDGMAYYNLTSDRTLSVDIAYNLVQETWDGKRTAKLRSTRQPPVLNELKRGNTATVMCVNGSEIDEFDFSLIGFTAAFNNLYK
ncbi:hypothetical protein ACHELW_000772 [Vibrio vulnificus]